MRYIGYLLIFGLVFFIGCSKEIKTEDIPEKNMEIEKPQPEVQNIAPKQTDLTVNITLRSADFDTEHSVTIITGIINGEAPVTEVPAIVYDNDKEIYRFKTTLEAFGAHNEEYVWFPKEAGKHTIKAVVDPYNEFDELSETNNEISFSIKINQG